MQPAYDFLRPYWPTLLFFVVFPVLAAALNWALWWDTPERWDAFVAQHPKRAQWIRILRAIAPHLRKLLTVARDGAASKGAPQAVVLLSPRVEVIADKAGAVVSETRGFDPGARQTIAPDVVAEARRITDASERGSVDLRTLGAIVVVFAVATPMGALIAGCPRLPPVSGCQPEAQTCIADSPHVCSASQRWHRAGDLTCTQVGAVCLVAGGRAYCGAAADGGL